MAEPHQSGQPLCAAPPRDDAELDFRLTELRRARGHAYVAGERDLAAATQREAVDHGNDRLGIIGDLVEDAPLRHDGTLFDGGALRKFSDIRAGNKCLVTGARDHDDAHTLVTAQLIERAQDFTAHSAFSALRLSGRFTVSTATPASTCRRSVV